MLKTKGFSLIELLIVIIILALIVSVGASLLAGYSANQRVKNTAQLLQMDISYARQQAVSRRASIRLAAVTVSTGSGAATVTSTSWNNGWQITDTSNGNQVLKIRDPINRKVGITGVNSITFNAQGWTGSASTLNINNRTAGDGCVGNRAKRISISSAGQITISNQSCN